MKKMNEQLKYYYSKFALFIKRKIQAIHILFYKNSNKEFVNIIRDNRLYLSSIDTFLTEDQYKVNDYGIPKKLFEHIDKKINDYPTYSDLLIFISRNMDKVRINYLEIGVSVMKNYLQIVNQFRNSLIVGFDNNEINPNFSKKFTQKKSNYFTSEINENKLIYFIGDLLDEKDTDEFKSINEKFDLIFSDALHTKKGVMAEYRNIIKDSLSDTFVLYFDDLDFPDLTSASLEIFEDLKTQYDNLSFLTFDIHGWVGENEKFHRNGFITNIDFDEIFKKEKIKLRNYKKII